MNAGPYQFSDKSESILRWVHPDLVAVARVAIQVFDFTVLNGPRDENVQRELVAAGRSTTMNSKHVVRFVNGVPERPSRAFDIQPYPMPTLEPMPVRLKGRHLRRWLEQHAAFYAQFGFLGGVLVACGNMLCIEHKTERYAIRWGGDWDRDGIVMSDQKFQDLFHCELRNPEPIAPMDWRSA